MDAILSTFLLRCFIVEGDVREWCYEVDEEKFRSVTQTVSLRIEHIHHRPQTNSLRYRSEKLQIRRAWVIARTRDLGCFLQERVGLAGFGKAGVQFLGQLSDVWFRDQIKMAARNFLNIDATR